ncbi:MAG: uroporphyrinogen decarboxylase family protein [bacterium]
MTGRDRVLSAIAGRSIDRVPVAFWRHFPAEDQRAESLAAAHIAFQKKFDWDFLKVTPASGYYGDDWGLRASYKPNPAGTRQYTDRPIKKPGDWSHLKPLDVTAGVYGRELHALRLVRDAFPQLLILSTIFSPLAIARTLSGDQALVRYLRESPEELHRGLESITDVTSRFAAETLSTGVDGIFFATQCATTEYITVEEYEEFGRPYDLRVLDTASGDDLRVLHIHGTGIMFDQLTDYPADVINWHDRRTPPTLREARERYSGSLAGGVNETGTLASGTSEAITTEVRDAIAQTGGTRLILAPGCTIPIDISDDKLHAVRKASES